MINQHINKNFEIEINGLRGIAVIFVILFHYEIYPFSGGYIGVDIFFVISGYLIGKIINKTDLSFENYKKFIFNRIRRIFPGLLGLVTLSFFFFSLILSPNHFIDFSKSIFYNFALIPNYFFWTQSNYFDVSSYYKPLLHTWSLGVEYHFYLVWPFFIWFLSYITKKNTFKNIILIFLIIVILIFTEYLKKFSPIFEHRLLYGKYISDTIFFLSPFRIFEFTIGYLLTFNSYRIKNNFINEILFLLGLILIFFSAIKLDNNSYFPGLNALYPTIGAFLIIFSMKSKFSGNFLRNRFINFFGYISFSLYLYHWPIYVFFKYLKFTEISLLDKSLCIIISIFFSFLSYKYIEKFYLVKKKFKLDKTILTFSILTILLSVNVVYTKGWDFRLSEFEKNIYYDNENSYGGICEKDQKLIKNEDCLFSNSNKLDFLLVGDSHGKALYNGVKEFSKKNNLNLITFEDMCKSYPNFSSDISSCKINLSPPETIIIGKKFYNYQYKDMDLNQIAIKLVNKIVEIKKNKEFENVKKIIIFGQVPEFYSSYGDLKSCYTRPLYINKKTCDEYYNSKVFEENSDLFKINQGLEEKRTLNKFLKKHIKLKNTNDLKLFFLDPFDKMCDETKCIQVNNGKMIYSDATHLSIFGSKYLLKEFEGNLLKILKM